RELLYARVVHRVDAALDVVQQAVAGALVHRADGFAVGGEGDLDGVIEAAAAEAFEAAAVGTAPPDAGGEPFEPLALAGGELVTVPAVGPVEPAVGSEERPVDVAAVAVEVEPGRQLDAPRRHALVFGVFEPPEARVRGGVQRPVVPEYALGEDEPVGENLARVELAVAVGVLQQDDPAELLPG